MDDELRVVGVWSVVFYRWWCNFFVPIIYISRGVLRNSFICIMCMESWKVWHIEQETYNLSSLYYTVCHCYCPF